MSTRRATIEDAEQIASISVETWKDTYKGILPQDILDARKVDEKRISDWQKKIKDKSFITLVYENDHNISGYLWAGKNRDNNINIPNEIYAIYVKPKFQGKGIGKALFKEYHNIINHSSFYLYMLKGNTKTSKFYSAMGGKVAPQYNRTIKAGNNDIDEIIYIFEENCND